MLIKYVRPSGSEIEVADTQANRDVAEKLDWKLVTKKPKPKRTRKAKEDGRNS